MLTKCTEPGLAMGALSYGSAKQYNILQQDKPEGCSNANSMAKATQNHGCMQQKAGLMLFLRHRHTASFESVSRELAQDAHATQDLGLRTEEDTKMSAASACARILLALVGESLGSRLRQGLLLEIAARLPFRRAGEIIRMLLGGSAWT